MSDPLEKVLTYTLIPVVATIAGGIIAAFRSPGEKTRISVQHFAAGVVFAAVAAELLPELVTNLRVIPLLLGFSSGVALMLAVRWAMGRLEKKRETGKKGAGGLLVASGVDVFIDGLLVGISFDIGLREGIIITIALTIELLFLAVSVASSLAKENAGKARIIASTTLLALLVLAGATLGGTLLEGLSGGGLEVIIAFATAALLYLVTEELLVEAHDGPDTAFTTAMFFVGFLSILILESLTN
ncbi:MAG: transporter [Deltaproteobacteria bacterium]